jgi:hypothetical protein
MDSLLDYLEGRLFSKQLINQLLVYPLLISEILNGGLELVKRVLKTEKVIQIEGEVGLALLSLLLVVHLCFHVRVPLSGVHSL